MRLSLKACDVQMLIVDEADRLKPDTFPDVRDICDKLEMSVVLVGTDRLEAAIKSLSRGKKRIEKEILQEVAREYS